MKKILFITNKCPPYRIKFFEILQKKTGVRILFIHEKEKLDVKFKHWILKNIGKNKLKFSLSLKKELLGKDLIILPPTDFGYLFTNIYLYYLCKKKKMPYIIWTERWYYKNIPFRDKISGKLYNIIEKGADAIIVPGKKSFEYYLKRDIKKEKIITAPDASIIDYNSKEIHKLKNSLIKKYGLKNKKVILYIGRLISRKGLTFLIDAVSKINNRNIVLMIVGGGDFYKLGEKNIEKKLKNKVRELHLEKRVLFTGEYPREKLPAFYKLSDIFVYPSITEKIGEPWGLALNEAAQFGLPLISTDAVGSAPDLIRDGKNGFIVKEKDSKQLKEKIEKILESKKLREKMGRTSLKIIKKFKYEDMVSGFIRAIKITK